MLLITYSSWFASLSGSWASIGFTCAKGNLREHPQFTQYHTLRPALLNDKELLNTSQSQKVWTNWKDSWNWAGGKGEGSLQTAECSMYCSRYFKAYFKFYHCPFIIVEIAIVWSWKDSNNCWKFLSPGPFVHFEAVSLSFVGANHWYNFILLEELLGELTSEEIRTTSDLVVLD